MNDALQLESVWNGKKEPVHIRFFHFNRNFRDRLLIFVAQKLDIVISRWRSREVEAFVSLYLAIEIHNPVSEVVRMGAECRPVLTIM